VKWLDEDGGEFYFNNDDLSSVNREHSVGQLIEIHSRTYVRAVKYSGEHCLPSLQTVEKQPLIFLQAGSGSCRS
jgi:hypothetical protein